jgi:hypothetical protein
MQKTPLPMPMQQRHAHLRRHSNRLRVAIRAGRLRVEDCLPARTARQIDQEGPGRASLLRLMLRGLERNHIRVIV